MAEHVVMSRDEQIAVQNERANPKGEGEGGGESETKEKKVKKIPLVEAFGPTIQGEGAMVGVRTSFLRFGLCDYRCTMCDSLHAVDPVRVKANANWLTPEEITNELLLVHDPNSRFTLNAEWVTFSGGNPCMHDLTELIQRIKGLDITHGNIKIAVETQGTLRPRWLHMCDVITVSPKSPGMGEEFELDKFMQFIMEFQHHPGFNVKVVVFSMADIEWASAINNIMKDWGLADKMYLSLGNPFPPGMDAAVTDNELRLKLMDEYSLLCEDLLQLDHMANVKFLPQLHVLAWSNRQKV